MFRFTGRRGRLQETGHHVSVPAAGGGEAFKRTKRHILAPEAVGRERRSRRVYGSQNQHMHASPVSEQVTPSSSYLSFLSMQQHPTQPTIEASQKMIATTNSALTIPGEEADEADHQADHGDDVMPLARASDPFLLLECFVHGFVETFGRVDGLGRPRMSGPFPPLNTQTVRIKPPRAT